MTMKTQAKDLNEAIAVAVLDHCYGSDRVDDRMIELTTQIVRTTVEQRQLDFFGTQVKNVRLEGDNLYRKIANAVVQDLFGNLSVAPKQELERHADRLTEVVFMVFNATITGIHRPIATAENAAKIMQMLLDDFIELAAAFPELSPPHKCMQAARIYMPEIPKRALTEDEALEYATHRHYKGGLYRKLSEGKHSETGEEVVVYEHLYPHERGIWVRPTEMFNGHLEDGTRRFTPL